MFSDLANTLDALADLENMGIRETAPQRQIGKFLFLVFVLAEY